MGKEEDNAFELMKKNVVNHQQAFEKFKGRLIKEFEDGILAVFNSADEALNASLEIQQAAASDPEVTMRTGLLAGEIIIENNDIFTDRQRSVYTGNSLPEVL